MDHTWKALTTSDVNSSPDLNNKIHSDLINKYWLLFQKLIIHIQLFNGKIDPPSEYDEVDEEVIYSQESPKMEEVYRDFDWELDRFAEYRLLIINSILNSILAVIYLTKLQNLINRPVMNCSMSIFPYFYFSNNILFDFPSSGLIVL